MKNQTKIFNSKQVYVFLGIFVSICIIQICPFLLFLFNESVLKQNNVIMRNMESNYLNFYAIIGQFINKSLFCKNFSGNCSNGYFDQIATGIIYSIPLTSFLLALAICLIMFNKLGKYGITSRSS
jgi:hypothetical protein